MLCKCSGKYIDIYFKLKITFMLSTSRLFTNFHGFRHKFRLAKKKKKKRKKEQAKFSLTKNLAPKKGWGIMVEK